MTHIRIGHMTDRRLKLQKGDKVVIKIAACLEFHLPSKYGEVESFTAPAGRNRPWLVDVILDNGERITLTPSDMKYDRTFQTKEAPNAH